MQTTEESLGAQIKDLEKLLSTLSFRLLKVAMKAKSEEAAHQEEKESMKQELVRL